MQAERVHKRRWPFPRRQHRRPRWQRLTAAGLPAGMANLTFPFGPHYMIPLVRDWAGRRRDGVGYYNPQKGTFTLRNGLGPGPVYRSFRFGRPHMIPVVGNCDAGASDGVGHYDPVTGTFYLRTSLSAGPANEIIRFGPPRMVPLTGDWFGELSTG